MTTRPLLLATLLAAALAAADVTVQHTDADKTVTPQDEQLPAVVSEEPQQPAWGSREEAPRPGQYIETPGMWQRMRYSSLQQPDRMEKAPLQVEPIMRQLAPPVQVPAAPMPPAFMPDSAFSYYTPAAQPYNIESRQFVDYSAEQLRYPEFPPPRPVDFQPQPRIPGPFDVRPAGSGAAFGMFPEQRQRAPWMALQAEEQYAMKPVRWQSDMVPPPMTNEIPDDYSSGRRWSGRQTNELEDRRQPDDDDDDSDGALVEEEVVPALVVLLHKKGGKSLHDKADRFRRSADYSGDDTSGGDSPSQDTANLAGPSYGGVAFYAGSGGINGDDGGMEHGSDA